MISADLTTSGASPAEIDIAARLLLPGDPGYVGSAPWNQAVRSEPAAVVEAHSAADVVAAVRYAAANGLRVAVRSSGHGAVPIDGSTLLIHTGAMTDFSIDPDRRVARMSAGTRWQPVIDAAARFGLAPICGSAPGIGVVGYLTGGGLGPLARTYGVSSDFVRSMEVVVGDGRILRATPTENEDLYWGLRGGKATLGIVTSIEMDLVWLDLFYGGALWFDMNDAPAVLTAWREMCAVLPEKGTTSAAVLRLPPLDFLPTTIAGRQSVAIRFGWVGDADCGERYLGRIRDVATPILDDVRQRPYTQIAAVHSDPVAPSATTQHSALLGQIDDQTINALLKVTAPERNRQNIVELRQLGGAVARERENSSAFCHREAGYSLFIAGSALPDQAVVDAHASEVLTALAPWTMPGLLPNFAASDDPAEISNCYDTETRHWLEELGDHYDPAHVLHTGQVVRRPVADR
jgi:hypothetical protein